MSGLAWTVAVIPAMVLIVATLEQVWGRPIPRWRYSPSIARKRIFYLVPAASMGLIVVWAWQIFRFGLMCNDCYFLDQCIWVTIAAATLGWLVYFLLLVLTGMMRVTVWMFRLLQ